MAQVPGMRKPQQTPAQAATPYADAVLGYRARGMAAFHTPGHKLGKGAFAVSGVLGNLGLSWPMVDHQVDTGTCPGEPQGTNNFYVRWGSWGPAGLNTGTCMTKDNGANGTVVYDSTYKPPFGYGGAGSATTDTCKGELKRTARP